MARHNYRYRGVESRQQQYDQSGECELPDCLIYPDSPKRVIYGYFTVIWVTTLTFAGFIATMLAYIIKFLAETDTTGFEPGSRDFDSFKNSRFKECYGAQPDATNCSVITALLKENYREDNAPQVSTLTDMNVLKSRDGPFTLYDWCQVASCLQGFKVIPSAPRPSAVGLQEIGPWCFVAILMFAACWHMNSAALSVHRRRRGPCRGMGELSVVDWALMVYAFIGPFAWWWVTLLRFAVDKSAVSTLSILAWTTAWNYAGLMRYHPYRCAFPKRARLLKWTLVVLASLQWLASVYVISVHLPESFGREPKYQEYVCLESQVDEAPGTSSCSPQEICSSTPVFKNLWFHNGLDRVLGLEGASFICIFTLWIFCSLVSVVGFVVELCCGGSGRAGRAAELLRGPSGFFFIAFPSIFFGAVIVAKVVRQEMAGREGPFAILWECDAVHVPLSPWRFYFDVNDYHRALRMAQVWLAG